jgi:hypothetical protein
MESDGPSSNPDLSHHLTNEGPLNNDTKNGPDYNEDDKYDDNGDIDGPTVEAHVKLSKKACKYHIT